MRIALFITCINDLLYPQTGVAVIRILQRLGHHVEFPADQTCCGQMHANSGNRDQVAGMIAHFVKIFDGFDAVVAPSGSCVAIVRDQHPHLHPDGADLARRTYELSEFLLDVLGVTDLGARFPHRVTYHPTSSWSNLTGLRNAVASAAPSR